MRSAPERAIANTQPRIHHATALADELGGQVVGSVAVFDHATRIEIDRSVLTDLPYGVPIDQPLLCFDLETTGLATGAGTLAFLVGLGWWREAHSTCDSYCCRITQMNAACLTSWRQRSRPTPGW